MAYSLSDYITKLNAERDQLIEELSSIAVQDPETGDWELRLDDISHDTTEENSEADGVEDATERAATMAALETKYRTVMHALTKTENGAYGICEISGEEIEPDRLFVNPSARTCKAHMNDEATLGMV